MSTLLQSLQGQLSQPDHSEPPAIKKTAEHVDPMVQMSMLDRSAYLSCVLATKTASHSASTDPIIRSQAELFVNEKRGFSKSLQGICKMMNRVLASGDEKAIENGPHLRKGRDGRSLCRTQSVQLAKLEKSTPRRSQSQENLTRDYFETEKTASYDVLDGPSNRNDQEPIIPHLISPIAEAYRQPVSPKSPYTQEILRESAKNANSKDLQASKASKAPNPASLQSGNAGTTNSFNRASKFDRYKASRRDPVEKCQSEFASLDSLPSPKIAARWERGCQSTDELVKKNLVMELKQLWEKRQANAHESPASQSENDLSSTQLSDLVKDDGPNRENLSQIKQEPPNFDEISKPLIDLIDYEGPALPSSSDKPMEREGSKVPKNSVLPRDLSKELLKSPSREFFTSVILKSKQDISCSDNIPFSPNSIPPEYPHKLAWPETAYDPDSAEGLAISALTEESSASLLGKIQSNYNACLKKSRTSIPLSQQEIFALVKKYLGEIDLVRESADPKHLFMIPLNDANAPRWVPPASRLRVTRNSPWLQSKSLVVSRNHCEVFYDIDGFFISDVGSSSGTFINGSRLSDTRKVSPPCSLITGDIIQLGIDILSETDNLGNLPLQYQAVKILVLFGYPRRATAECKHEMTGLSISTQSTKQVISAYGWTEIHKLTQKIKSIPRNFEGSNLRIYFEFGDLIHAESAGLAVVFYQDKVAFSVVFNNYKLLWQVAMTDAQSYEQILVDPLPQSNLTYGIMQGSHDLGRITALNNNSVLIQPLATARNFQENDPESCIGRSAATLTPHSAKIKGAVEPVYTVVGGFSQGLVYLLRRNHQRRKQVLMGEAQLTTKNLQLGRKSYVLEGRIELNEGHQQHIILGCIFAVLQKIDKTA